MNSIELQRDPRMQRCIRPLQVLVLVMAASLGSPWSKCIRADDWLTWPSTYTHDPRTGLPTDQYAQPVQPIGPNRSEVVRSGYRHFRSTLQVGQSTDNMHIVEQWGQPVVPYEEWRFPYRPFSVPYDAWGPPVGGWGNQPFFPGGNFIPGIPSVPGYPGNPNVPGYPLPGFPNIPGNFWRPGIVPLQPQYQGQPWFDGTYPSAPPLDPRSDQEFFYRPQR